MRRFFQLFGFTDSALSLWTFVKGAGWLSAFAIPAWAAWAGSFMAQSAPFSWIGAGIVSFVLITAGFWLRAKAIEMTQLSRFRQRVFEAGGMVNPLEKTFTNKRIRVAELCPPIGGMIEGKTFVDCEIVGPANVMFQNCTFQLNRGEGVDGLVLDVDAAPRNGFGFKDCGFTNCRFYLVTFMVPPPLIQEFMRWNWTGMNWISNSPEPRAIDASPELKASAIAKALLESRKNEPPGE